MEVAFLVPRDHLSALELVAGAKGITVAHLLRRVIQDHVARHANPGTSPTTSSEMD